MSVHCKLVVGFEVDDKDLFIRSKSNELTCVRDGHPQVDPNAKFCSTCGAKCHFEEKADPTKVLLEFAKIYIAPQYDAHAFNPDWAYEINEILGEDEGPLYNVARVQGGRDTGLTLVIGEKLNYIHEADTASISVTHEERLKEAMHNVKTLRDSLGFSKNHEVRLYMSLYYS